MFMLLWQGVSYSQNSIDTIDFKAIEIVADRLPDAYKISQLDSTSIKQATNLSDLLNSSSTVFIKSYGSGSLASVSFRGTGASHTSVLWNGIAINSPMNGQVDFSLFPTAFIDGVELNYGASGLINGNGALGGSVNLQNNSQFNKGLQVGLTQSIGSFNNYTSSANIGFSNTKWTTTTKLYFKTNQNNFKYTNTALIDRPIVEQFSADLKQYGLQQEVFRKLKNGTLGLRVWYFNSDRNLPGNMLNYNKEESLKVSENQKDESYRAMLEWKGFANRIDYKLSSTVLADELIYENTISNIHSKSKTLTIDNKVSTKAYLNNNFTILNNLSIRFEQAESSGFNTIHSRFNNYWLFGITKRLMRLEATVFNRLTTVGDDFNGFSPSVGARYQLFKKEQLSIKANAAINYNYPTFNDLYWSVGGNEDLLPEKSEMLETGLSYTKKFKSTLISSELTSFYSHVYDWIIWMPNSTNIWSPSNLKQVENKGLEYSLTVKTKLNKIKISFNGNYSYTISTNLKAQNNNDKSVSKQLIYVPYHQLNYTLNLQVKNYLLSYNYNYTGLRYTSTDNNWYLPANFISNIALQKSINASNKTKLTVGLKVNNLLNQEYQAISWRAMPGRNYLFTFSYQFR